jgi:excisionase family DNA binding protein
MPTLVELLTAEEVAERVRVSERTVWRWAKTGVLRPIRIGGITRFGASDIEALLKGKRK